MLQCAVRLLFSRGKINQVVIINQMIKILEYCQRHGMIDLTLLCSTAAHDGLSLREGICLFMSKHYTRYVLSNSSAQFFSNLNSIANQNTSQAPNQATIDFIKNLLQDNNSVMLGDKCCIDSFCLISNSQAELAEQLGYIFEKLKKGEKTIYCANLMFGKVHSCVLVIDYRSSYQYYLYDPNNPDEPILLNDQHQVSDAIYQVLRRMQLAELPNSLLHGDNKILLTFYLYPAQRNKEIDQLIASLLREINDIYDSDGADPSRSPCLYDDVKAMITMYQAGWLSLSVLLSNIMFLSSLEINCDLLSKKTLKCIENLLQERITTNELIKDPVYATRLYYTYFCDKALTLTQMRAYLGELETVLNIRAWHQKSDSSTTPPLPVEVLELANLAVDEAGTEGHALLVSFLLREISDPDHLIFKQLFKYTNQYSTCVWSNDRCNVLSDGLMRCDKMVQNRKKELLSVLHQSQTQVTSVTTTTRPS